MSTKTIAYDFSLFETNKNNIENIENIEKKAEENEQSKILEVMSEEDLMKLERRKHNPLAIIIFLLCSVIIFTVAATLVKSEAMISELNSQITSAENELQEQENAYSQYQMQVESIYSLRVIEDYAKNELGMVKIENNRKEFISLSEGDKAEIIQSSEDKNILQKIADAIAGLWS